MKGNSIYFRFYKSIASREARIQAEARLVSQSGGKGRGTYEKGKGTKYTGEGRLFYRCRQLISDANSELRFLSVL